MSDPDGIGVATLLNLTLDNQTPRPVTPSFFVYWLYLPYLWTSNSTQPLAPSSSASYMVTATDGVGAVPRSTNFRVYVYDVGTGNLVGQSLSFTAEPPLPAIANSHFRWWTLDPAAGTRVPYNWKLGRTNVDPLASVIQGLDQNKTSGISLQLNDTSVVPIVERVTLYQTVFLNSTKVKLSLYDPFETSTGTRAALGVAVTDGTHQLLYLFSNSSAKQTVSAFDYNATVLVPIAASAWTSVSVDPNQDWLAQGWAVPNQVTFSIFLQAGSTGVYSAAIRDLNSLPPTT